MAAGVINQFSLVSGALNGLRCHHQNRGWTRSSLKADAFPTGISRW